MKNLIALLVVCCLLATGCQKKNTTPAAPDFSDSTFYFHFNFNNADYNYKGITVSNGNVVTLSSQANDPAPADTATSPAIMVVLHFPVYSNPSKEEVIAQLQNKTLYFTSDGTDNTLTPYITYTYQSRDTAKHYPDWESQLSVHDTSYNFHITNISYLTSYTAGSATHYYYSITGTCKVMMREEGSNIVVVKDLTGSFHLAAEIGSN